MAVRVAVLALLALLLTTSSQGQPLIADISDHRIRIDSGFTGSDVLLFGAIEGKGDMVVVVRGPDQRVVVRRKDRVAGMWMNRAKMTFDGVPAYYAIASSRALDEIAPPEFLALYQIGLAALRFTPVGASAESNMATFHEAILRNRRRDDLYREEIGAVRLLGGRLFRTEFYFPANVPTGSYRADIYLIRDGIVVSAETAPLFVTKTGFQAEINDYAQNQPAIYGVAAIAIALFTGWAAAAIFRKT